MVQELSLILHVYMQKMMRSSSVCDLQSERQSIMLYSFIHKSLIESWLIDAYSTCSLCIIGHVCCRNTYRGSDFSMTTIALHPEGFHRAPTYIWPGSMYPACQTVPWLWRNFPSVLSQHPDTPLYSESAPTSQNQHPQHRKKKKKGAIRMCSDIWDRQMWRLWTLTGQAFAITFFMFKKEPYSIQRGVITSARS